LNKLQEANDHYAFLKETLSGINDHGTDDTSPTFKLLEDTPDFTSKEETALHAIRLQKFIEQLQNALIRIENKTYGVCTVSGQLIPKERLKSVPHTTKSVNAKINESKPN
jgi:RNA polymerase-binding transcription factor DksA